MTRHRPRRLALLLCLFVAVACDAGDPTPWEQFGERYETERIRSVVGDQALLIASFNASYEEYETCAATFDAGSEAEREFQEWFDAKIAEANVSVAEEYGTWTSGGILPPAEG